MRDQTCPALPVRLAGSLRAAREVVKGWPRSRLYLLSAILLALGGLGVSRLFVSDPEALPDSQETLPVLVVDRYVPAFAVLKPQWVTLKNVPRPFVPPGALHSIQELTNEKGREIFLTAVALPEQQPVTRTVLTEIGKGHGLASVLPAGKIAVSIAVDKVHGVGGWIQPGDTVSVFQTGPAGASGRSTQLVFPALEVLAVDKNRLGAPPPNKEPDASLPEGPDTPEEGGMALTFLVNPPEAVKLIDAREHGSLSVALRAMGDDLAWDLK